MIDKMFTFLFIPYSYTYILDSYSNANSQYSDFVARYWLSLVLLITQESWIADYKIIEILRH